MPEDSGDTPLSHDSVSTDHKDDPKKTGKKVSEQKKLIPDAGEHHTRHAKHAGCICRIKSFGCASFTATLVVILFGPFLTLSVLYLILGLNKDLFLSYGTCLAMYIYKAWIIANNVIVTPKVAAKLEARKVVGVGLAALMFLLCLVTAGVLSLVEGALMLLFTQAGSRVYMLMSWQCVSFFFVTAVNRHIFRGPLMSAGMCPVRAIFCLYMVSWFLWALVAGQLTASLLVPGLIDPWSTWGAFMQSMINGVLFGGHAMWPVMRSDKTIEKIGMAATIAMLVTLLQMVGGYGIIALLASLSIDVNNAYVTHYHIMNGVFMFALTGTLVLTQIGPLYEDVAIFRSAFAFGILHIVVYFLLTSAYYFFFSLAVIPLFRLLLGVEHMAVEAVFPIIVFPLMTLINIVRVSRFYSAPCCHKSS